MEEDKNNPWVIFNYEVFMLIYTTYLSKVYNKPKEIEQLTQVNALVESRFLHLRVLTELLISKNKGYSDDICLNDIIDESLHSSFIKNLIDELKATYGKSSDEGSPCWTLNKMLVHPSRFRSSAYNYSSVYDSLFPIIFNLLTEIHTFTLNEDLNKYLVFAQKNIIQFIK